MKPASPALVALLQSQQFITVVVTRSIWYYGGRREARQRRPSALTHDAE
jgi:hypothetical protein